MAGPARRLIAVLVLACALETAAPLLAQQKRLTFRDVYGPDAVAFSGAPIPGPTWVDRSHVAWPRDEGTLRVWTRVDVQTGETAPLFDRRSLESELARLPGVTAGEARRLAGSDALIFNPGFSAALVGIDRDLLLYTFDDRRLRRVTTGDATPENVGFSPDAMQVAFTRHHNLFTVDLRSMRERQLTRDGTDAVSNGVLDWVYEEEIYGRGRSRAYWWSPDSSRLAFLQLDDRAVPTSVTIHGAATRPVPVTQRYPEAGEHNPVVRLAVVAADGGRVQWADLDGYPPDDRLVVRVGWTPDSRHLVYGVQNRVQSVLDVLLWEVDSRRSRRLLQESSRHWIGADDVVLPIWMKDGSFLWLSDRTGWRHLYRYDSTGSLLGPVTSGAWDVRMLHGVDEAQRAIYFSGTERSPIGRDVYRVPVDGGDLRRVSARAGTHRARFNPDFSAFVDTWSDAVTPAQTRVHASDGRELRLLDANPVQALAEYRWSPPQFLRVPTRDGFDMEAMLIKPPAFDPSRKYPVYQPTYGGPGIPMVRDAWSGPDYLFGQLLAAQGVVVWTCDNRSASGKGAQSAWALNRRFGPLELQDIEDCLAWLKRQPWVDASRIGIGGFSFGGFVSAYALTHSQSFALGVAGMAVTDWRLYDSIYTERYLGLPAENPTAYDDSVVAAAAALHGALLIIHGDADDNVHPNNALRFADALQKAGRPFQMMLYPGAAHGIADPNSRRHMRRLMFDFIVDTLAPGARAREDR